MNKVAGKEAVSPADQPAVLGYGGFTARCVRFTHTEGSSLSVGQLCLSPHRTK